MTVDIMKTNVFFIEFIFLFDGVYSIQNATGRIGAVQVQI